MITRTIAQTLAALESGHPYIIFNGDCRLLMEALQDDTVDLIVTSPPYFMGKKYDRSYELADFYSDHKTLIPHAVRTLKKGGNICWQVGYHVKPNSIFPLDFAVFEMFRDYNNIHLRNRIIWHFGHGTHAKKRLSGRHETVLWFGKGENSLFNIDSIRVPQKYPGKKHYKGPKKGMYSGNPLGKNPSDVWEIPNVNANHVEKTDHPCQFPIALAQRLVRALSPTGGIVLDPFAGSGTTGIAAALDGRRFIGAETSAEFCKIAEDRFTTLNEGCLQYRPGDREIMIPTHSVSRRPEHFLSSN